MWTLELTDDYIRRLRKFEKKHPRELKAMLDNLDTFHTALNADAHVQHVNFGFIHKEPYGVKAIEAHYPVEVNEDNYHLYQELEKESGIVLQSCYPAIFYPKEFEFGSLSNPIEEYRDIAYTTLRDCIAFAKDKNLHHAGIWPGIDGYTYSLGTDYYHMWDSFEDAVARAMDEVPGMPVAIEPKPYEPAPNTLGLVET